MGSPGSVYLLYHFFHPDDVVSGRLFSDLAEDLTDAGFDVTALPSIRSCHGPNVRLKQSQSWAGGKIRRVWRPDWPQHKTWGRFGNTLCMLFGWTWRAAVMRRRRDEVMIVGTDPVLAVLIAITWRLLRPHAKIIHWCHDVYPHAAIADGMIRGDAPWVRAINFALRIAYRRCDVIGDLGICMRRLLQQASGDPVDPLSVGNHSLIEEAEPASARSPTGLESLDGRRAGDRDARAVIAELAAGLARLRAPHPNPLARDASVSTQLTHPPSWEGRALSADVQDALPSLELDPPGGRVKSSTSCVDTNARDGDTDSHWRCGRYATLVPWSLVEPAELVQPDAFVRDELFGPTRLGVLYSGNFGRGHCFESAVALARRLRGDEIGFCFAGRGLRLDSVRRSVTAEDTNVRFAGFADEDQLESRLSAADVHLVSLRPSWTGAVVPSKFFGALASGRPVLFAGSPDSAIAQWIEEFGIGWVLTERTMEQVAGELNRIADDPLEQEALRQRCFDVYHSEFSRRVQIDRWLRILPGRPGRRWPENRLPRGDHADSLAAVPVSAEAGVGADSGGGYS